MKQEPTRESWLEIVHRQVGTLQFGMVQIIVHESKVVQVERTEKVRLGPAAQTNLTADQATGGSTTHSGSLTSTRKKPRTET